MPADQRHNQGNSHLPEDKKPLIISVVLHLAVFAFVIFGIPNWHKDVEIDQPVAVELVDNISDTATTNKPPAKVKPVEKPTPEPPKKQEKKNTDHQQEKVEKELPQQEPSKPEPQPAQKPQEVKDAPPPPDEEILESIPEKESKVTPKKVDLPKEKPLQPTPEPKPQKEKPKEKPKKQVADTKKTQESFDSLLKDLTPNEKTNEEQPEESTTNGHPEPAPDVHNFSTVLSMTELDALRYQLSQCWNIQSGARDSQDLSVDVRVEVNQSRVVTSKEIVDQNRYINDSFFRAAADSALRALNNPACTPLNLPPEKYDQWHEMTINFDPREMF